MQEARQQPPAPAWEKLKKAELAELAEREIAATGWLPAPLRQSLKEPRHDAGRASDRHFLRSIAITPDENIRFDPFLMRSLGSQIRAALMAFPSATAAVSTKRDGQDSALYGC